MYDFAYHRPRSLGDALAAMTKATEGKFLAGGQTLLPVLKQRLAQPSDLIDLGGIESLKGIRAEDGGVTIGAMTLHADVAASPVVKAAIPALAQLADGIGDPQVRNRGTLGGSVANNDLAADYPAALLALGATIRTNRRQIAADDFFTGMFETALGVGEIITAVAFPAPEKAAYIKFRNLASRYAVVGVFVAKTRAGVRVAVTGAGPCVFRMAAMEKALTGHFAPAAIEGIAISPGNLNADMHASPEYRAHLTGVMARRAVAACG